MLTCPENPYYLKLPGQGDSLDACEAGQLMACAETAELGGGGPEGAAGGDGEGEGQPKSKYIPEHGAIADDSVVEDRWGKSKEYSALRRTCEIWGFIVVFFVKLALVGKKFMYRGGWTEERQSARKAELAVWLREGLVKLGPTFIKIGQQFSTRVDVLSPEFIKELEKLQDSVPPFSSDIAMRTIEEEIGGPIESKFRSVDRKPIAAASLGQVHRCVLQDGREAVVKVQRPGLKGLFEIDLKNIRKIAQFLQAVDPKTDGAARDWVAIYDECCRILYQEIDYTMEGKYADNFRENFSDTDWVKVPEVYWELTTPQILTMEYAPGIKINRADELDRLGIDKERIARLSVECYLQQILKKGLFHADPHPGNIAVDPRDQGTLIFYDFGMMGRIPDGIRGGLINLFYAVYKKNADDCIDSLVTMGVLVPGGDMTAVKRTARFFLDSLAERLEAQKKEREEMGSAYNDDFKGKRSKEDSKAVRKKILANIGQDLLVVAADQPFRFPALFTFVVRAFSVLDGIGKSLDPKFDISEIARPYAKDLILESKPLARFSDKWKEKSELQNRAFKNLFTGPNSIEYIEQTIEQLERGDLKLRVRALEAERAVDRVRVMQGATTSAVVAGVFLNGAALLTAAAAAPLAISATYVGAAVCGLSFLGKIMKIKKLEKKEASFTGA